jgi:hypothetical protein
MRWSVPFSLGEFLVEGPLLGKKGPLSGRETQGALCEVACSTPSRIVSKKKLRLSRQLVATSRITASDNARLIMRIILIAAPLRGVA